MEASHPVFVGKWEVFYPLLLNCRIDRITYADSCKCFSEGKHLDEILRGFVGSVWGHVYWERYYKEVTSGVEDTP